MIDEEEPTDKGAPSGSGDNLDETQALDNEEPAPKPKPQPKPQQAAGKSAAKKTTQLGDYRLLKKLGQGGMGAVFKAHQISLDRTVAVKIMSKELSQKPDYVKRFLREARVMAKLDHPNILRCYEIGNKMGFHYLAVEYVEGGSIEDRLKNSEQFSIGDSLHIILACADALQHAHDMKLIHRDIKPENILLTTNGIIKVADLGLAKAQDDDMALTKTGTGAGTPIYMAPEQARDAKNVDHRADIYALGVMLYVFLTGKRPFSGTTLVDIIEAKEKGKFDPVRKHNDEVPERLDLIVEKMLANKPEMRYQTCAEVIADLEVLGLENETLSFVKVKAATNVGRRIAATTVTKKKVARGPGATPTYTPPKEETKKIAGVWFVQLTSDKGKTVVRQMKTEEILNMIKSGILKVDTQLSQTRKGGYRDLGSYREFNSAVKAILTKQRADKKGEKYRSMYEQIEKEDRSRRRWRWLHNLFLSTGSWLGLLIWLVIVAGVCVGGYFLVKYGIQFIGDKVNKL